MDTIDAIDSILKGLDEMNPIVKNGYISHKDLDVLMTKLEKLSQIATQTKVKFLTTPSIGLDVIFPAIHTVKLFLDASNAGSLALVSKTMYESMVLNFTQSEIDLYILMYYILNPKCTYNVNIEFAVDGKDILVPIPANIIALRRLRFTMTREEYFETYEHAFFKEDVVYLAYNKQNSFQRIFRVCVFCKEFLDSEYHYTCEKKYHESSSAKNGNCRQEDWTKRHKYNINYVCPELEYLVDHTKQKMPLSMIHKCGGQFEHRGISYEQGHPYDHSRCTSCDMSYVFHKLDYS